MPKKQLRHSELLADPYLLWNSFVSLLAYADPAQLDPLSRAAFLIFWYEHEVQNGGHLQFFLNRPEGSGADTALALRVLGANAHADLLSAATRIWNGRHRDPPQTAPEYVEEALEGEFDDFDSRFYALTPTLPDVLEQCLQSNKDVFFEFVD